MRNRVFILLALLLAIMQPDRLPADAEAQNMSTLYWRQVFSNVINRVSLEKGRNEYGGKIIGLLDSLQSMSPCDRDVFMVADEILALDGNVLRSGLADYEIMLVYLRAAELIGNIQDEDPYHDVESIIKMLELADRLSDDCQYYGHFGRNLIFTKAFERVVRLHPGALDRLLQSEAWNTLSRSMFDEREAGKCFRKAIEKQSRYILDEFLTGNESDCDILMNACEKESLQGKIASALSMLPGYCAYSSFNASLALGYLEWQRCQMECSIYNAQCFNGNVGSFACPEYFLPFIPHWLSLMAFPFDTENHSFYNYGSLYLDYLKERFTARCMIIHLACLQWVDDGKNLQHGFDGLISDSLGNFPLDPFDGKPIRYKVTDKAIYLWSVGPKMEKSLEDFSIRHSEHANCRAGSPVPLLCSEFTYRIPVSRDFCGESDANTNTISP